MISSINPLLTKNTSVVSSTASKISSYHWGKSDFLCWVSDSQEIANVWWDHVGMFFLWLRAQVKDEFCQAERDMILLHGRT